MTTVLAPGFHQSALTHDFIHSLPRSPHQLIVPDHTDWWAYSPQHLLTTLQKYPELSIPANAPPLLFIGFSAGTIACMGAASQWCALGGKVSALIALDGWGVPLWGQFSIYRISHDAWTHHSSHWLGGGSMGFYADPPVEHLTLWRSPHTVTGHAIHPGQPPRAIAAQMKAQTAAEFIDKILHQHQEVSDVEA